MTLPGFIYLLAAFSLLTTTVAKAAEQPNLGGFMLGNTFEASQQHALDQEWKLVPLLDDLPKQWVVEGANLSLFVCNGIVASITEHLEGDLEEFTALVFTMQLEFGKPDIQILSLPSGVGHISTIDVRFDTDKGGAKAQLQSIAGKRNLSVSYRSENSCN